MAVYVTGLAVETGPLAPVISGASGVVAGSLSGMVGYVGGKSATRVLLDTVAPEIARKAEREAVAEIRANLDAIEKKTAAAN